MGNDKPPGHAAIARTKADLDGGISCQPLAYPRFAEKLTNLQPVNLSQTSLNPSSVRT